MNQLPNVVGDLRNAAYQIDPVLWVREVLGVIPTAWQQTFLRAPRGASILALTARQVGKTTTAAWAIGHAMVFMPACPAQRQSAEAVRRIREILVKVGAKLVSDNVYALELDNGSRVLALPGTDDSIRGLTARPRWSAAIVPMCQENLASRNSTSCRGTSMAVHAPVRSRKLMPATTGMP